ncbi:MAG: aminopeptidase P family protein [Halieaceae bacterium]
MELIQQRLGALREQMAAQQLDALIIPRADEYLGEYLPEHNERMYWASNFTGSAGVVIVLRERAAIFVDGRYTVQVRQQVSEELFEILHLVETPNIKWLSQQLEAGARVGYDPRMHSLQWQKAAKKTLAGAKVELVETPENLIDLCWHDRPQPEIKQALLLDEKYTGQSSAEKRVEIGAQVAEQGAEAALIFAPDSVAWLLNIRGRDIPSMPLVLGFAMLYSDGRMQFFTDPAKIPEGFDNHVGEGVKVLPEADAPAVFAEMSGHTVLADPVTANAWCQLQLQRAGAELIASDDPVLLPKACKNNVEVQGMRDSHVRDGVAEVRFLAWLDAEVAAGKLHTEAELSDKLFSFRAQQELFQETSFDTISAAAGNAAMCHYNHLNVEQASALEMDSVYLVDSGGQYLDGTTDITRTVAIGNPGDEVRKRFTLVLKGHIALDRAVFPEGTTGTQLDILARQFLWHEGLDYDHGTGHGVGAFLSVHEGPQRIAKTGNAYDLRPGMVVSNEPGYYKDDSYGIRCENLVVVRESGASNDEGPGMLEFEAITMVPFDRRLVDESLLDAAELAWLNNYHSEVREKVAPYLDNPEELKWLEHATQAIGVAA